jgi:hypothetical protein
MSPKYINRRLQYLGIATEILDKPEQLIAALLQTVAGKPTDKIKETRLQCIIESLDFTYLVEQLCELNCSSENFITLLTKTESLFDKQDLAYQKLQLTTLKKLVQIIVSTENGLKFIAERIDLAVTRTHYSYIPSTNFYTSPGFSTLNHDYTLSFFRFIIMHIPHAISNIIDHCLKSGSLEKLFKTLFVKPLAFKFS